MRNMKMHVQKGKVLKGNLFFFFVILLINFKFVSCSVTNGKYMDELKYSNMHTVASLDESKYQNCHVDSLKALNPPPPPQQYPTTTTTTNLTNVGGCHTDDVNDNSMTVIKSEDTNQTHSYILPPFLH